LVVALLVLLAACRHERDAATYIPADATVLAGAELSAIRKWVPDSLREASDAMVAYNGKDVLFILRGNFTQAPMGGTLINPHLALAGSPEAIRAAQQSTGASSLLGLAPKRPVWLVARGGGSLPLTGNAANLNKLVRLTDYVTAGVNVGSRYDIEIEARCPSADAARQVEETVRAAFTLALPADVVNGVERSDSTVRVTASASPELIGKLLR
jgi:hypothetical protein